MRMEMEMQQFLTDNSLYTMTSQCHRLDLTIRSTMEKRYSRPTRYEGRTVRQESSFL